MHIEKAVIGGTGFYDPGILKDVQELNVQTRYGEVTLQTGTYQGVPLAFLPRHGKNHKLPPHRVNYRANIAALQEIGVHSILGTTAVGSLREEYDAGTLVILDQFIDFTKNREQTFYDGSDGVVIHTDFTYPFCPELRKYLGKTMSQKDITFVDGGTYICVEGPRYETSAEIRVFSSLGADVVGMTLVPEAVLAREAGLCYSSLSLVTNLAAGLSPTNLSHKEVVDVMEEKIGIIRSIFLETLLKLPAEKECLCSVKEEFPLGEQGKDD